MPRTFLPRRPPRRRAEGPGRPSGAARGGENRTREHERALLAVCGPAAVAALFDSDPGRVLRLFFEPRLARDMDAACRVLATSRKPYRAVGADELAHIAGTAHHGGAVAVARPKPLLSLPDDPGFAARWARDGRPLVILDGIGNPHNLGAIARSAAYFGIQRLILADRPEQALPSAASYRVAEGGLDRLELFRAPLPAAFAALKEGYRIVGTALGSSVPPTALRRDRPVALVFGNEEQGIERAVLAACDTVVTIPGSGRVQSLNVAAAAAVLLYVLTAP